MEKLDFKDDYFIYSNRGGLSKAFYDDLFVVECDKPFVCFYLKEDVYKRQELYFKGIEKDIRTAFRFREQLLSEKTRKMAEEIRKHPSVSIHIRRQDYLLPNSVHLYGNICTCLLYTSRCV